jgi:hypothetical protein
MSKLIDSAKDGITDVIEKFTTPADRAGATIDRVGNMAKAGVSEKTIAQQLTDNDRCGQTYQASEIPTLNKIFNQSQSAPGITAQQARALIQDQSVSGKADEIPGQGHLPA